jgi:diguanylate cyclase (GGDEF)-like protein
VACLECRNDPSVYATLEGALDYQGGRGGCAINESDTSSERAIPSAGAAQDRVGGRRDRSADQRDRAASRRDQASDERDRSSDLRDREADRRDLASEERDQIADERDRASDQRDLAADQRDIVAERLEDVTHPEFTTDALDQMRVARAEAASDRRGSADDRHVNATDREQSAEERGRAETDRSTASTDREAGESERGFAEADRTAALADRDVSASDRKAAHLDELTGAYRRGPGFAELDREVLRALRTEERLAVAFVDIDHLKTVNDTRGHAAGDLLLRQVADALRAKLRPYDIVIRYGGDEFVCVMAGQTAAQATARLASMNTVLRTMSKDGSMSVGISELQYGDSPTDLVKRADDSLYLQRQALRQP